MSSFRGSLSKVLGRSLAFAALVTLAVGCQAGAADAPKTAAADAKAAPKVLATVNGAPISQQDVEAKVLEQVLQRQPNLLETALAQVIDDRVLDLEAAKQKLTRDQLVEKEVKSKIAVVSDADVDKFYEEKKAQIRAPKEQIAGQIKTYLENQHQQEGYGKYMEQLRTQYAVKNLLADQRAADEAVKATERRAQIEGGDQPTFGAANASVILVEFSDFQCPFCSRIIPAIDGVKKNYADRVKIVFHQFPLNSIHPFAQKAAEAALCAQEQGKFWELHDLLFKEQDKLDIADLKDKATRAGLNAEQFNSCLDGGKMVARVAAEIELGTKIGVQGTPTVYLNGRQVQGGALPYEELAKEIDAELAKTKK
ncbi:MAG: thioredoxin domain-containing protein [Acidobacteriota bacterium]